MDINRFDTVARDILVPAFSVAHSVRVKEFVRIGIRKIQNPYRAQQESGVTVQAYKTLGGTPTIFE